jgi:hypothetical protein
MVIGIDHMKEEHVMVVLAKESLAAEKLEELTIVSQSHTNTQNELKDVEKEKKKVDAKLYSLESKKADINWRGFLFIQVSLPFHPIPSHAMPCHAMPCQARPGHALVRIRNSQVLERCWPQTNCL